MDGWVSLDALPEPAICHTRGYLVKETEGYIVIAGTIGVNADADVGNVSVIPRSMVKEIKTVRQRKKKDAVHQE